MEGDTEAVTETDSHPAAPAPEPSPRPITSVAGLSQYADLFVFMVAVVGALALGLGITNYLREHPFVFAYLVAYAGFRFADILVRPTYDASRDRDARWHRLGQLPPLLLFFAAPFERTYAYATEPPALPAAIGLVVELLGLWLALGARIQLGRFATPHLMVQEGHAIMRSGFYNRVRHPIYLGTFLTLLAWPMIYGAPIVAIGMIIVAFFAIERRVHVEEAMMLERFGEDYATYMRETDRLIPGVW
jgi:protein-S-isoprenylcysteine O-methyltransferase Ste14